MSSETNTYKGGGIGFFGLLTILFIGLKLGGVISWSWFWVLSPLIFSVTLGLLIFAVVIAWFIFLDKR